MNAQAQPTSETKPYPYQEVALRDMLPVLRREGRALCVMPCGTGKTIVGRFTAERLRARTAVVLVPSLLLVRQTLRSWLGSGYQPLLLCGDYDRQADDAAEQDREIQQLKLKIPTTTEPADLRAHLSARGRRLIIATYQSALRLRGLGADLLVLDEVHHTIGPKDKAFGQLLREEFFRARWRLSMTATPRVLKEATPELSHSMDDPAVYGPRAHELRFSDAVAQGLLVDFRVVIAALPADHSEQRRQQILDQIRENRKLYNVVDHGINVDLQYLTARDVVAMQQLLRARQEFGLDSTLSFHHTVRAAARCATYGKALELPSQWVSGQMSARTQVVDHFVAHGGHVANCRYLGEGVDITRVDSVLFVDPKQQLWDILQALGRALRIHPGKREALVLLPVVVESVDDLRGDWAEIRRALLALRMLDERLDSVLLPRPRHQREAERSKKSRALIRTLDSRILLQTLQGIGDYRDLDQQIRTKILDTAGLSFERLCAEEQQHQERTGRPSSNSSKDPAERRRGGWWQNIVMSSKGRGSIRIDTQRLERLRQLPCWGRDLRREKEIRDRDALIAFGEAHGGRAPNNYNDDEKVLYQRLRDFRRGLRGTDEDRAMLAHLKVRTKLEARVEHARRGLEKTFEELSQLGHWPSMTETAELSLATRLKHLKTSPYRGTEAYLRHNGDLLLKLNDLAVRLRAEAPPDSCGRKLSPQWLDARTLRKIHAALGTTNQKRRSKR